MGLSTRSADGLAGLLRKFTATTVILLACVMTAVWVFAPPAGLPGEFAMADCRRVALRDDVSGQLVVGAEDLALTPSENEMFVTAHDRRDPATPSGALYSVSMFALETAETEVSAAPVWNGAEGDAPFRPHGLALSADGTRLAVVNRPEPGAAEVLIGSVDGLAWAPEERLAGRRLCRANDLDFADPAGQILDITLDRAECTGAIQDLLPGARTGRIARFDGSALTEIGSGYSFPNGIAAGYLAETRTRMIRTPQGGALRVPGGPDNLSVDQEGWIVAALHPKLVHTWLYRAGWRETSPTRIVRVDPSDGEVEVLFDDVDGTLFSGATSAVLGDGLLVAGSAFDSGLLVCRQGEL